MLTWKSKQEGRHHFCSHGGAFSSPFFFRVARRARRTPANFGVLSTALEAPFRNHPPAAELRKKKKVPSLQSAGEVLANLASRRGSHEKLQAILPVGCRAGLFLNGGPQKNMACPFPLQNQPIRTSACFCALYELLAIFREASKRPWELWNQLGPSKLTRCLVPS